MNTGPRCNPRNNNNYQQPQVNQSQPYQPEPRSQRPNNFICYQYEQPGHTRRTYPQVQNMNYQNIVPPVANPVNPVNPINPVPNN